MKRLVLIDGHAIIHRAYHALPVMTLPNGEQVHAVYGFISMLFRIIEQLKPTHLAAAFDLPGVTFRQELYLAYQSHRPQTEEGLIGQFQIVRDVTSTANIPVCIAEGFEADDVIGTICQYTVNSKQDKVDEVIIVTGDRDILQLVTDKIKVFIPTKGLSEGRLFGEKDVEEYLGVKPSQVVDYKALVGDSSDNYPGVPGIGPKTALTLLSKYGTFANIYKALSGNWVLGEKIKEKLTQGYESGKLSKQLAQIEINVPIKFEVKKAILPDLKNNEKFIKKLEELRFKSLISRIEAGNLVKISKKKDNGQIDLL